MTKEEQLLCKRMKELALNTYNKGYQTFSDFLNLNEMNLLLVMKKELPPVEIIFNGGYESAERKMVCFSMEQEENIVFPIHCIRIVPRNVKFSDTLTHRDYLGALINLGIERYTIGDIVIRDKEAYVFSNDKMCDYIVENLCRVKHTDVNCDKVDDSMFTITPKYQEIKGTVASIRLDAVLALAFNGSRSSLSNLIPAGKVFVNSRLIESNSYMLKEGDVVSVRGYGKFIYYEQQNQTKKGRYFIVLKKYI